MVGDKYMEECCCGNCNHSLCAKKVPIFSFLSDDELIKIIDMTGYCKASNSD